MPRSSRCVCCLECYCGLVRRCYDFLHCSRPVCRSERLVANPDSRASRSIANRTSTSTTTSFNLGPIALALVYNVCIAESTVIGLVFTPCPRFCSRFPPIITAKFPVQNLTSA
jgi:hypothetical protein